MRLFHAPDLSRRQPSNCSNIACPAPLSRKALRRLMPGAHARLTGEALASSHARKPGPGRFRKSALAHLSELEKAEKRAENRGPATAALVMLRQLFITGSNDRPAHRPHRLPLGRKA